MNFFLFNVKRNVQSISNVSEQLYIYIIYISPQRLILANVVDDLKPCTMAGKSTVVLLSLAPTATILRFNFAVNF